MSKRKADFLALRHQARLAWLHSQDNAELSIEERRLLERALSDIEAVLMADAMTTRQKEVA